MHNVKVFPILEDVIHLDNVRLLALHKHLKFIYQQVVLGQLLTQQFLFEYLQSANSSFTSPIFAIVCVTAGLRGSLGGLVKILFTKPALVNLPERPVTQPFTTTILVAKVFHLFLEELLGS